MMKDKKADDLFLALALEDLVKDPVIRQAFGLKLLTEGSTIVGLNSLDTGKIMPTQVEVNNRFVL